jgi:hypothetical protein
MAGPRSRGCRGMYGVKTHLSVSPGVWKGSTSGGFDLSGPRRSRWRWVSAFSQSDVRMRLHSGACVSSVRCVSDDGRPRGADAPRSCVGVRTSAGEKTMFAMHERTLPGAAGVSPPWAAGRIVDGQGCGRRLVTSPDGAGIATVRGVCRCRGRNSRGRRVRCPVGWRCRNPCPRQPGWPVRTAIPCVFPLRRREVV